MELRFNCPSVLWLLPHGYVPDSLGTVVLKIKNPGKIVATFSAIKQALESLGHCGEIKKKKKKKTLQNWGLLVKKEKKALPERPIAAQGCGDLCALKSLRRAGPASPALPQALVHTQVKTTDLDQNVG